MTDGSWVQDLVRPIGLALAGRSHTGNAAFSSAVASGAGQGWVLSVPAGRGTYEVEMAGANPRARVLCLSNNWDVLLEVRRRGLAAGLTNLYFVRGIPRLLPIQDQVMDGLWTNGLHRYATPERELTQMVRATRRTRRWPACRSLGGALTAAVVRLGCLYRSACAPPRPHRLARSRRLGLHFARRLFLRFSARLSGPPPPSCQTKAAAAAVFLDLLFAALPLLSAA
jgi:hypothetical protein